MTKHEKGRALAPALARLGIAVEVVTDVDTDRFGTFSGEIAREGDARAAIERKWAAAGDDADLVLASEGSFGPHPVLGIVAAGLELVGMRSRVEGWQAFGRDFTLDTNHRSATVTTWPAAQSFARDVGFPAHAIVAHHARIDKGLCDDARLEAVVRAALAAHGRVRLEADMRAHVNPTRMRAIARAAEDLARRLEVACPRCGAPGFGEAERLDGRPCRACGAPTHERLGALWRCDTCAHEERRLDPDGPGADPGSCDLCNP